MLAVTLPATFETNDYAAGLSAPTSMAFAPDGRLFVTEKGGAVRVIKNGALLSTPFTSLTVDSAGERGLLGLDFDPNFTSNGYLYVYHTVPGAGGIAAHNRVTRFTASDADPGPGYTPGDTMTTDPAKAPISILDLDNLSGATNHNGGAIHFGPDGKLYVAVGENANRENAQTLNNRLGKILRINPDGSIPTDNPFFTTAVGANRSIWALGLRNPYTFAFQPGTGKMYINDVGENTFEEVNEGGAGRNFGWPRNEGFFTQTDPAIYTEPLNVYGHGDDPLGRVITGGTFYNPTIQNFPSSYLGKYFFADYNQNWIHTLDPASPAAYQPFAQGTSGPVDLDVGPDGALYYLNLNAGTVGRVVYTQDAVPPRVTGVYVAGTAWSSSFLNYLGGTGYSIPAGTSQSVPLTWVNANQIKIKFSENVQIHSSNLVLNGSTVASYQVQNFGYDPTTFVATWTLQSPLGADRLRITLDDAVTDVSAQQNALDGEFTNAFPTGNGPAGGVFNFAFNSVPGDVNSDTGVNTNDTLSVRAHQGSSISNPTNYLASFDVNGDGGNNTNDTLLVRSKQGTSLPQPAVTPAFSTSTVSYQSAKRTAVRHTGFSLRFLTPNDDLETAVI